VLSYSTKHIVLKPYYLIISPSQKEGSGCHLRNRSSPIRYEESSDGHVNRPPKRVSLVPCGALTGDGRAMAVAQPIPRVLRSQLGNEDAALIAAVCSSSNGDGCGTAYSSRPAFPAW